MFLLFNPPFFRHRRRGWKSAGRVKSQGKGGRVDFRSRDPEKTSRPSGDREIDSYLKDLKSLKGGEQAIANLIKCGRSAIEPLRRFLFEGSPSVVYQPRQMAVQALGGLGARDLLVEYLRREKDIADPAVRLGEEAVESAAAREFIRWPSEEVFQFLLGIARERCLPGVCEALGEFKRREAIPFLVMGLEDDVCRRAAEEALRKIGPPAHPDLIQAAVTPRPGREEETPSSLFRRRSAVRLLGEIGVQAFQWPLLRPLLREADGEILAGAFRIAAGLGGTKDRAAAFRALIRALERADWYVQDQIEKALAQNLSAVRPLFEEEIRQRQAAAKGARSRDPVGAALWRICRRAEGAGQPPTSREERNWASGPGSLAKRRREE